MADKERDQTLREMAQHRGFKLVKSRRRKAGGDFGRYGLKSIDGGEECLGFDKSGLTATADEIEAFLRKQTASTWKKSLSATKAAPRKPAAKPAELEARSARQRSKAKPSPPPPEEPKLRIREADVVDAKALEKLVSAFAPATADEIADRLALLRHQGEPPLIARLGDDIVGVLTWHVTPVLHRPKPVGRITYLQVDEKARDQGIGKALVDAVEARLAENGCGAVEVTSNVRLTKAHGFYRKLGYERTSYRFGKPLS
jgi:ribosomal protein S18 acetylase RimI-like enzyme